MILTKFLTIKVNHNSLNYYKSLGYDVNCSSKIIIPIEHLTKGSHQKIDCKCNYCDQITNITYKDYLSCIKKTNKYSCTKCKFNKAKLTNLEKYGFESALQNKEIKNKQINTNNKKYGFNCPLGNKLIKDKSNETLMKNYGVDNPLKSLIIKDKFKETCLKKYGYDNPNKNKDVKEKLKNTCFERYGYGCVLQNKEIKVIILS